MRPGPLPRGVAVMLAVLALCAACDITRNPAPEQDGATLYLTNCSNCHGTYGEGDGAVAPGLAVQLQDLRYLSARNDGTFPTEFARQVIDGRELKGAHGPARMPVWGSVFQAVEGTDPAAEARVTARIDALVAYLESRQVVENPTQ